MPVHNDDVARVFEKIADLLEIRGENPFRVRAYRNGAREIRGLAKELAEVLRGRPVASICEGGGC